MPSSPSRFFPLPPSLSILFRIYGISRVFHTRELRADLCYFHFSLFSFYSSSTFFLLFLHLSSFFVFILCHVNVCMHMCVCVCICMPLFYVICECMYTYVCICVHMMCVNRLFIFKSLYSQVPIFPRARKLLSS